MSKPDHIAAHEHSSCHRKELEASEVCGCFCCLAIFPPSELDEWLTEPKHMGSEQTAFCPRCGIDSVIGSASGYPITREFLERMHSHWF